MSLKTVIFDVDGTIVRYKVGYGSSWDAIFYAAGLKKEQEKLLEYYLYKPEQYPTWFKELVKLLKGVSVSKIKKIVLPPEYSLGAKETCLKLKKMGYSVGILSSCVDLIGDYIKDDLNLDFCRCSKVFIENGYFTGEGEYLVHLWKKDEALRDLCLELGIKPSETAYVGDHVSDIPVFKIAGFAIAYRSKDSQIKKNVDTTIFDLKKIPFLIDRRVDSGGFI